MSSHTLIRPITRQVKKDSAKIRSAPATEQAVVIEPYSAVHPKFNPQDIRLIAVNVESGIVKDFDLEPSVIGYFLKKIKGYRKGIIPVKKGFISSLSGLKIKDGVWRICLHSKMAAYKDLDYIVDIRNLKTHNVIAIRKTKRVINFNRNWSGDLSQFKRGIINQTVGRVDVNSLLSNNLQEAPKKSEYNFDKAAISDSLNTVPDLINTLKEGLRLLPWKEVEVSEDFKLFILQDTLRLFVFTGKVLGGLSSEEQDLIDEYKQASVDKKKSILAKYDID